MEAQNINQVFDRISNCIASSNTLLQLETTERLVELFRHQNTRPDLNEQIGMLFIKKAETLHYFEWKNFQLFENEAA